MPKKRPEYRNNRSHTEFLTTIDNYMPSQEHFEELIMLQFSKHFNVQKCVYEDVDEIVQSVRTQLFGLNLLFFGHFCYFCHFGGYLSGITISRESME